MACNAHTNTTTCTHTNTTTCTHTNTTPCAAHAATTTCAAHAATTTCGGHANTTPCGSHVNSCPAHGGYVAPVTPTSWSNDPIAIGEEIKAVDHNELRNAIDAELTRRSKTATIPALVSIGSVIDRTAIAQIRNAISTAKTWAYPAVLQNTQLIEGEEVVGEQFTLMQDKINEYEAECVCDCNYSCTCQCNYSCTCQCNYACTCQCNYSCTCQCNYSCTCQCNYACTCQCNYACTCNCNYCTCQCNYACTCNCNYSDERLKTDIVFF